MTRLALVLALVAPALAGDAPEISRSVGKPGGIVVFWPRVIPRDADPAMQTAAVALQRRLEGLVRQAVPNATLDVRPEPERVCPRSGCKAPTVGVLLAHSEGGCAAVALVSADGAAPATLVPWIGKVDLKSATAPFREPPESQVIVRDFARCDDLEAGADDAAVVDAIGKVYRGS